MIPTEECSGGELTSGVNGNRQDHCSGFDGAGRNAGIDQNLAVTIPIGSQIPGAQLAWNPNGTRCGKLIRATGPAFTSVASNTRQ